MSRSLLVEFTMIDLKQVCFIIGVLALLLISFNPSLLIAMFMNRSLLADFAMIDLKQVHFIIGILGTALTFVVYTLPMPEYISLYKDKSVGKYKGDYSISVMRHTMLCVFYGLLVREDVILLSIGGLFVLVIEAIYLSICFISFPDKREYIVFQLVAVIIFVVAIVLITLFAIQSTFSRQTFAGVICLVSYILSSFKASLPSIKKAVETKSVEHIPLFSYFVSFIYAGIWTAYSVIYIIDFYPLVANAFGTMLYASILIIYAIYYKSTPKAKTV